MLFSCVYFCGFSLFKYQLLVAVGKSKTHAGYILEGCNGPECLHCCRGRCQRMQQPRGSGARSLLWTYNQSFRDPNFWSLSPCQPFKTPHSAPPLWLVISHGNHSSTTPTIDQTHSLINLINPRPTIYIHITLIIKPYNHIGKPPYRLPSRVPYRRYNHYH